jgi:hypothetical protein
MTVPLHNLTDAWTDGGTTYDAIKMNVTNTASAAASKLLNLQVSAASRFSVDVAGCTNVGVGAASFEGAPARARMAFTNAVDWGLTIQEYGNAAAGGGEINLTKSRNATVGTDTVVQDGDILGSINAFGYDTNNYARSSRIMFEVDGTPGDGDMPGRIRLLTSPDGSGTLVERMRINNAGWVSVGASGSGANAGSGTSELLSVNGFIAAGNTTNKVYLGDTGGACVLLGVFSNSDLEIRTNNTERVRISNTGQITLQSSVATPAGGSTTLRLVFGSTAGFGIYVGSGVPTVSAAQGSIYLRSDGSSTSTRLYVNTNGSTTWTNVTTAA